MKKPWHSICGVLLAACILCAYTSFSFPDGALHLYFLNIGQGDSILIRTPSGQNILVDGGPGTKVKEELSAVLPFYEREIDLLVLTHPDKDHIEGTLEVLKHYQVKKVLFTGISTSTPFYNSFLSLIHEQKIPFTFADSRHDFYLGDQVYMDVLYPLTPLAGQKATSLNNSSVVFKLLYGGHAVLFTGDIEESIEEKLLASKMNLSAEILKVAHHGSKSSSSEAFLKAVNPDSAIIQSGVKNSFGHPHAQILDRLIKSGVKRIYRNDLEGRIEIVMDDKEITVQTRK